VLGVERGQQRDDRVPHVGSPPTDDVAADCTLEPVAARIVLRRVASMHRLVGIHHISFTHRLMTIHRLVITLRLVRRCPVEYTHVAGKVR
jgi:hypothetical protein